MGIEVKRPEREADHLPATSAEVKEMWIYNPLPHTPSGSTAYLVKHRDNFTFTFFYLIQGVQIKT
jgi:hypothetical protein